MTLRRSGHGLGINVKGWIATEWVVILMALWYRTGTIKFPFYWISLPLGLFSSQCQQPFVEGTSEVAWVLLVVSSLSSRTGCNFWELNPRIRLGFVQDLPLRSFLGFVTILVLKHSLVTQLQFSVLIFLVSKLIYENILFFLYFFDIIIFISYSLLVNFLWELFCI